MDAIAARGNEELKKHGDWAEALKIPPEILSGSEEALKAWAADTAAAVRDLTRPDLINGEQFVENYKQGLRDEAAKKLTIDIAGIGENPTTRSGPCLAAVKTFAAAIMSFTSFQLVRKNPPLPRSL